MSELALGADGTIAELVMSADGSLVKASVAVLGDSYNSVMHKNKFI